MKPPRRGLDRIRSPQERLLEQGERDDPADGRAALFTGGRAAPRRALSVHCGSCDALTPLDAATALRAAAPLFLLAPWRDHPVFAVCPSCRSRSWLAVRW